MAVMLAHGQARPRARELGLSPGILPPGAMNAITDVAGVVDDVCFYRSLKAESVNHPPALYQPDVAYPQDGAANWSNGYLPAHYQGTPLRPEGAPILDMTPPAGVTDQRQRANLEFFQELNRLHQERHPGHAELAARVESYELAFRMQAEMPGILDLSRESPDTLAMYGIGSVSGLLRDLKRTGLLDETTLVWAGEFGRSPDHGIRGSTAWRRDHNAQAMTVWLAGGGVKSGQIVGATDEVGGSAVDVVHPLRDLHVTLLHLLGLDDARLRFFHAGREKQLSQVGGQVIRELLA